MKISEVADNKTIFQALSEKYLKNKSYKNLTYDKKLIFNHSLDLPLLRDTVKDVSTVYGIHPWQTKEGAVDRYAGFSLTFNPFLNDHTDVNASSLGSSLMSKDSFFYSSYEQVPTLKNSYFDTYAFTARTPSSRMGYLDKICNSSKRTIIRSRLMGIDGNYYDPALVAAFRSARVGDSRFGWHRDEPIYSNLRINIPIDSSEEFVFEMEHNEPYVLETGKAYSWNTNIPHRVYCNRPTSKIRTNLVIGVSPWFDLVGDEWIPNEFCGKKNPQQMLIDGDVFDWIKLSEGVIA